MKVPNKDLLIAINENKVLIKQCMLMLNHIIKKEKDAFFRIERKLKTGEL